MTDEDMKELKRLQSLECHLDTYETKKHGFNYHEMMGIASITVYNLDTFEQKFQIMEVDLMSHDEFANWCKEYERGKKRE